jgi:hypothetical protein
MGYLGWTVGGGTGFGLEADKGDGVLGGRMGMIRCKVAERVLGRFGGFGGLGGGQLAGAGGSGLKSLGGSRKNEVSGYLGWDNNYCVGRGRFAESGGNRPGFVGSSWGFVAPVHGMAAAGSHEASF